jgi:tryptophan-rich sensory protein
MAAGGPPLTAALVGSLGSRHAGEVYQRLTKPRWAPPVSVFGPVWSGLYALIGVAGWRMWRGRAPARAWGLHAAQLTLNAAWPWTFFTVRDKRTSLAVITALDLLVAAQLVDVVRQDRAAAAALVPYFGWSLFATALNTSVSDPTKTS